MWKSLTLSSLGLILALPVTAQAEAKMDADGDGVVSMSEFNNAMPDAGAEVFSAIDTNADGALSDEELQVAREDGILPAETSNG
jgi:Ca2+-binding EF-hand superfamily protein